MLTEYFLDVSGLQLLFDRPDTETDIDMDIEVDPDTDVEIDARLPVLSQSLNLAFPLIFGLIAGHRNAAAASASLDVPVVNVDTGLVLLEACVCVSKLVKLLNEATELSCPGTRAREEHVSPPVSTAFVRLPPSNKPSLIYRSDCDDFLIFEDNGLTEPPSSSVEIKNM